jgi:hypothetical protein
MYSTSLHVKSGIMPLTASSALSCPFRRRDLLRMALGPAAMWMNPAPMLAASNALTIYWGIRAWEPMANPDRAK